MNDNYTFFFFAREGSETVVCSLIRGWVTNKKKKKPNNKKQSKKRVTNRMGLFNKQTKLTETDHCPASPFDNIQVIHSNTTFFFF